MQKSEILYEPLPIGRIGVRKDNEEVVIAKDFSCFAHMLEEYISFGAVNIVMPKSAPEVSTFDQMPSLLRKRIRVIDDENEIEAMRRLLFNLRKEFSVKISDEDQRLTFPKHTPRELIQSIDKTHSDIKRLALGFNYGVQIEINSEASIKNFRYLREKTSDGEVRVILAQLESLMKLYGDVGFDAPSPPKTSPPKELISVFDRLINDQSYLEYSDSIFRLASPESRKQALIELRELERSIRSTNFVSIGWNYLAKVIKVSTGVPLPESSAISGIIQGRSLPALVNFQEARASAVEMWKKSDLMNKPLRRDGRPVADDEVAWLPPMESMEIYSPDNKAFRLGKVGELLAALEKVSTELKDGADEDNA